MEFIKSIIRKILIGALVLGILTMLFLYYANYSSGYRAGVPIKLSHKGTIFKTWEGELNIGGLTNSADGVMPTSWSFSVRGSNKEVREQINSASDHSKRVKLYYKEKFARLFWLGDTKYFVYKVEEVD